MSNRYYADSTFFNWLRSRVFKIDKPYALPWGGWDKWKKETKESRPIAYFICETLPDILEKPAEWLLDPIDDAVYYLRCRFIFKTHYLKTKLEPGRYHDFGNRILHGCFNELVDFVEIEKARMMVIWDENKRNLYKAPWWTFTQWFRWQPWRCPEAGIDHLKWEMTLDSDNLAVHERSDDQARSARELMVLYTWWTVTRPARKDEWDETGLRAFWDSMEAKYDGNWL